MRAAMAAVVVLALAQPVLADDAKPRGGGSSSGSSGGSSSSGSRHSSPGASSSSGSSHSSGSSGSSASDSSYASGSSDRRHPRPGTGQGYRRGRGGYYSYPYYPYNNYYYGYYPRYGYWGWGSWGYYPSYGYGYDGYGYRTHYYRDYGSVRVLVEPEETRVYVDGYYAGVADDFDGIFQRLHVTPGRHEVMLKLEGYRTHRMKIWVPPSDTIKIHHDMIKGSGEDTVEDLAGPVDRYADDRRGRDDDRDRYADDADDDRDDRGRRDADDRGERGRLGDRERGDQGQIRLTVRPDDASVYVDGSFRGSGRQVRSLELSAGRHRVEVVRPGFKTYDREVDVDGKPLDLEVELERP